ncbi:MAG: hypothetical protein ACYC6M_13260 [Terriglobales bacterium]
MARTEEEDARLQLSGRLKNRRKVEHLIEELLEEVQTGVRKDTLTAYIEARGGVKEDDPETADERQRGPTAVAADQERSWAVHRRDPKSKGKRGARLGAVCADSREEALTAAEIRFSMYAPGSLIIGDEVLPGSALPGAAKPRRPERHQALPAERPELRMKPAGGKEPPDDPEPARDYDTLTNGKPRPWTAADLDREVEAACYPVSWLGPNPWKTYRDLGGITDVQIEAVLRQLWGGGGYCFSQPDPAQHGHTTRGGNRPAFWMGARRATDAPPDLSGLPLIARVRAVLDLPRFTAAEADQAAARMPGGGVGVGKPRRKAVASP